MVARNAWASKSRLLLAAARGCMSFAVALISQGQFLTVCWASHKGGRFLFVRTPALWILLDCFYGADMLGQLVAEPPVPRYPVHSRICGTQRPPSRAVRRADQCRGKARQQHNPSIDLRSRLQLNSPSSRIRQLAKPSSPSRGGWKAGICVFPESEV
jgi:hypothetical protein